MANLITISPKARISSEHEFEFQGAPKLSAGDALTAHWPEYAIEACLLGIFMFSACVSTVLLEFPGSPVRAMLSSGEFRRVLGGLAMGATALCIFYSPWGKRSGAQINPAVTLTFFRLGRVRGWDALFYAIFQFAGALAGVLAASLVFPEAIRDSNVNFAATVPGGPGNGAAWIAEFLIAMMMMTAVLHFSSHPRLANYTGLVASILVATYIAIEAPFSGMSINPARSFGSALPSGTWMGFWIYLTAPPLAMLTAAEFHVWRAGRNSVRCAKLHHANHYRCIFCGANGGFER